MSIRNASDAKRAGQNGITYNEAINLIRMFKLFNPYHILPEAKAKVYLDENWEGRLLDLRHFGLIPRKRSYGAKTRDEQGH